MSNSEMQKVIRVGEMIDWEKFGNISNGLLSELKEISFPEEWKFPTSHPVLRQSILRVFKGRCALSQRSINPSDFTIDHIIPITFLPIPRGKSPLNNIANYQPLDSRVNTSKGNRVILANLPPVVRLARELWGPKVYEQMQELYRLKALAYFGLEYAKLDEELRPRVVVTLPYILSDLKPIDYSSWVDLNSFNNAQDSDWDKIRINIPLTEAEPDLLNCAFSDVVSYSAFIRKKDEKTKNLFLVTLANLDYQHLAQLMTDSFFSVATRKAAGGTSRAKIIVEFICLEIASQAPTEIGVRWKSYGYRTGCEESTEFANLEIFHSSTRKVLCELSFEIKCNKRLKQCVTPAIIQKRVEAYSQYAHTPNTEAIKDSLKALLKI